MRVPVEGGVPEDVPASTVPTMYGTGAGLAFSPDGKLLAFNAELSAPNDPQSAISRMALVNIDSNAQSSPRLIEADPRIGGSAGLFNSAISFTPDGKAIAYIIHDKGVDNIWEQPLDGSTGRQITNFTSERIIQFQWSPNGKTLAVARGRNTSDVVLLQEK
jgi:Tol biopolymer transport system component